MLVCVILCAPKYDLFGFVLVGYFVVFIVVYSCGGVTGWLLNDLLGFTCCCWFSAVLGVDWLCYLLFGCEIGSWVVWAICGLLVGLALMVPLFLDGCGGDFDTCYDGGDDCDSLFGGLLLGDFVADGCCLVCCYLLRVVRGCGWLCFWGL